MTPMMFNHAPWAWQAVFEVQQIVEDFDSLDIRKQRAVNDGLKLSLEHMAHLSFALSR